MTSLSRKIALAVAAPLLLAFAVVELLSYLALRRYGRGIDGMPTVAWTEFPDIDRELLEKYTSFDPELGWVPQPDREKQKDTGDHLPGEEVENVVTYSTDEYGSRVSPNERGDGDVSVSTYGDSYCFCRGVDDDETFQHYLAEETGGHVRNYGGGNYGLDQALMRLKRVYDEDPTDHVCMVVTASSIARILSTWKHYQEFGNVLAVKPRYELDDGDLERVESPIDEKTDLLDMASHAEFLREHDGHYEPWFRPHLASFPYALDLLRNPDQIRYAAYGALKDVERRLGTSLPGVDFDARQSRVATRLEQVQADYHDDLFDEREDLFVAIVEEFVDYSRRKEFEPTFVMVQQLRYAEYETEHGAVYGDLLDRLDERFDRLNTVDMSEHLGTEDVESLYVRSGEGGHYSPETNRRIADVLADEVLAAR